MHGGWHERCAGLLPGCARAAVVVVGVGPGTLEASVSTILRLAEEYGIECVFLVYTGRGMHVVGELARVLEGVEPRVRLAKCPHEGRPGRLERDLRRLVEALCTQRSSEPSVVVSPTPGSRRLATAAGMAGVGRGGREVCNVDVVHVDFYWGPWSGLPYPLVPRWLEPLHLLNPVHGPKAGPSSIKSLPWAEQLLDKLPGLRRVVARLAFELNRVAYRVLVEPERGPACPVLRIEVGGPAGIRVEANVCSADEMAEAAERLADFIAGCAGGGPRQHGCDVQLAGLLGLMLPVAEVDGGFVPLHRLGGTVVADTNLIYTGIHLAAYSGLRVMVPYCAYAEVMRNYAEALKWLGKECPASYTTAKHLAAGLALLELASRTLIIPSPPPPCDTAIPQIDPLLLENKVLATGDRGAYRFWRQHPSGRQLARTAYTKVESLRRLEAAGHMTREEVVSWASYALLQAAALLATTGHSVRLSLEADSTRDVDVAKTLDPELPKASCKAAREAQPQRTPA